MDTTIGANLPPQVRRQLEAVKAAMAKANGSEDENASDVDEQVDDESEGEDEAEEESTSSVQAAPEPQHEDWKQRYLSLQGKYNAEVPRLHSTVRELEAKVSDLTARLEKANHENEDFEQLRELESVFGEEDPQVKVAQELQKRINELEARLRTLDKNFSDASEIVAATAEDRFFAALDRMNPQWEKINNDPNLLIWLQEFDPLLGATRKAVFDEAARRLDAQRVNAFFNEFAKLTAKPELKANSRPSDKLSAQVTPSVAGGPTSAHGYGNTWTREAIDAFFKDVARGRYRGRDEERERIQREIIAASAKGHVVA